MSTLLLSGGLDSAVCLATERHDRALFVYYGQPHAYEERQCAEALAARFYAPFEIARIDLPWWRPDRSVSTMLVPGRNLILASLAAALGGPVIMGCNADDYAEYPDCRPEFFDALRPIVDVRTPLLGLTKPKIGAMARELGVADMTWSCYYPRAGKPCGECDACEGRRGALA